ncbi:MAG: hypothetical protein O3A00_13605 [Planctomycetota bacterium]|nr:hypothetical protein [Planctomycetota bacterium]
MTKPFALPELLSRARNLVERHRGRRTTSEPDQTPEVQSFGSVQFDYRRYNVCPRPESFFAHGSLGVKSVSSPISTSHFSPKAMR